MILDIAEKCMKKENMLEMLRDKRPSLTSMAIAMTSQDVAIPYTPVTYPLVLVRGKMKPMDFPENPKRCEHPPQHQYKHGNQTGRYRECRLCGTVFMGYDWVNPITKESMVIYPEFRGVRPFPGATLPKKVHQWMSSQNPDEGMRGRPSQAPASEADLHRATRTALGTALDLLSTAINDPLMDWNEVNMVASDTDSPPLSDGVD